MILVFLCLVSVVRGGPATESYKDQFCTDPRTGQKHDAYTEWADAYSCTRHRCQPGGRNLAIYTVGCKRIEAPESAIECEEVVEDTNMQFPFCCTRLRCLVLVRGEVWTRVLGQPWETLPAAPWSHMYKMKRPPPADGGLPKPGAEQGPVYEIAEGGDREVMRSKAEGPDCGDEPHTAPGPDIVIALGTHTDEDTKALSEGNSGRHKKGRKPSLYNSFLDDDRRAHDTDLQDLDENTASDKPADSSDERFFADAYGVTQKVSFKSQHQPWTEIPSSQWNEQDPADSDSNKDTPYQQEYQPKQEKGNLQALVDAIGSRMKDIESVVEKMTKKVHHDNTLDKSRFSTHNRGKYLRTVGASEAPLYLEDPKLNGYFSDASNGVIRGKGPKEPAETFMAVVDTRRRTPDKDTEDKKHKKHTHKRKGKHHKKHHTTKKRFNRLTSAESDKNVVSDDSSGAVAGN